LTYVVATGETFSKRVEGHDETIARPERETRAPTTTSAELTSAFSDVFPAVAVVCHGCTALHMPRERLASIDGFLGHFRRGFLHVLLETVA
jgi:hypothetical protein